MRVLVLMYSNWHNFSMCKDEALFVGLSDVLKLFFQEGIMFKKDKLKK